MQYHSFDFPRIYRELYVQCDFQQSLLKYERKRETDGKRHAGVKQNIPKLCCLLLVELQASFSFISF